MKKILFIGYGIDSKRREAISLNACCLIDLLRSKGVKVTVVNIGYKNSNFGKNMFDALLKRQEILERIKKIIEKEKIERVYDVFALPISSFIFTLPLISAYPDIFFIKVIQNDPGFSWSLHRESLLRIFANSAFFFRIVKNRFNLLVTRNLFLSKKNKIDYLPLAVPIYKENERQLRFPLEVCYLGHPLKKKGVNEWPGVMKNLPEEIKNKFTFSFAFSRLGEAKEIIKKISKEASRRKIKVNFQNEVDPQNFFRNNDIFIYPLQDQFGAASTPRSVIEAMEAGCLVAVTDIDSVVGLIENKVDGLLLGSPKADAIIETLIFLLENPKSIKSMTKRAREKVVNNYSQKNLEKYIKVIYA